jgi:hypothetical protein
MIGEAKLLMPPLAGAVIVVANILGDLPSSARIVLDLAALGVLFAGFLVVGRLRAESAAAAGAAAAWERERNAERAKAERVDEELAASKRREEALRQEIQELKIEMSRLEARPTLDTMATQLEQLRALMTQTAEAVQTVIQSQRPQPETT